MEKKYVGGGSEKLKYVGPGSPKNKDMWGGVREIIHSDPPFQDLKWNSPNLGSNVALIYWNAL